MKQPVYIWQLPNWPNFVWDSEAILNPMSRLSHLQGELAGMMSTLGFENKSEASLNALTSELIYNSRIEGVELNADSVRSSIARRLGIEKDGIMVQDHYVEGLVDVMLDAVNNQSDLTYDRLMGWHCALFPLGRSGMYRITVGDWRKGTEPMQVVSGAMGHEKIHYEAPPCDIVDHEMSQFIKWCNESELNYVIKAAISHLWFVTVHPFDDGNGRLSRTIADMYLSRHEGGEFRFYSMSAQINACKKSYYDVLERTQKGSLDITEWLLWFIDCLTEAVAHAIESVSHTLHKSIFWQQHRDTPLNDRQRKIINRLWDGLDGKLTTSKWAKMCKCSQDTALRDINDLIDKGILQAAPGGGRSANYILS